MSDELFTFKTENNQSFYECKHKHKSGQTFYIKFMGWKDLWDIDPINYYNTIFHIYNKKKQKNIGANLELTQTGKCGLDGLIWAKKMIMEFEKFMNETNYHNEKVAVIVGWANNKRRKVYERYLTKVGYNIKMIENKKCLIKYLY